MLTFHFFQATFQQRLHLVRYSRAFFSYHDLLDRGLGTTKKLFNKISNTTGTTCWEGSAYSSKAPLVFGRVRVVLFILCALRTVVCLLIVFRFRRFSLFIPLVSQITLFTRMIYMQKVHSYTANWYYRLFSKPTDKFSYVPVLYYIPMADHFRSLVSVHLS